MKRKDLTAMIPMHDYRAAALGDPVATRHGVDPDVDEPRTGAPDHVRTDASGGQLNEMRQGVQLTDHDLGSVAGRDARPRSDAGGGGENTHSLNTIRCD